MVVKKEYKEISSYPNTLRSLNANLGVPVNVKHYGAVGDGVTDDTAAIQAAIAAAGGKPILFPVGNYKWTGAEVTSNVCIIGEKIPKISTDVTKLENGSIITGSFVLRGENVTLKEIGVDHGSAAFEATAGDALKISAQTFNGGGVVYLDNVVGLGNDVTVSHAILVEGYNNVFADHITGSTALYAVALKSNNVHAGTVNCINSGTLCIIKSDDTFGTSTNVKIDNIIGDGNGISAHGLRILADSEDVDNIVVSNAFVKNSARALTVEAASTFKSEISIDNLISDTISTAALVTNGDVSVVINNLIGKNISAKSADLLSAVKVKIGFCDMSLTEANETLATNFAVAANVDYLSINEIDLYTADTGTKGTINFLNARTSNIVQSLRCKASGNIPSAGFSSENIDDGILNPVYDGVSIVSMIKVSVTGDVDVTEIATSYNGDSFSIGHRLIVLLISNFTVTFKNNTNIRNRFSEDVPLFLNQTIEFVFGGTSWHQVTSNLFTGDATKIYTFKKVGVGTNAPGTAIDSRTTDAWNLPPLRIGSDDNAEPYVDFKSGVGEFAIYTGGGANYAIKLGHSAGYCDARGGYKVNGVPGVNGTFTTADGKTVTVSKGIITTITV